MVRDIVYSIVSRVYADALLVVPNKVASSSKKKTRPPITRSGAEESPGSELLKCAYNTCFLNVCKACTCLHLQHLFSPHLLSQANLPCPDQLSQLHPPSGSFQRKKATPKVLIFLVPAPL